MTVWQLIVAIAAGVSVLINTVLLIINTGKIPFSRAAKHKEQHKQLEDDIKALVKRVEAEETAIKAERATSQEDQQKLYNDILKEIKSLRDENILATVATEKHISLVQKDLQLVVKKSESDRYTLVLNDIAIMDGLIDRGCNGPIKERKRKLEAYLTRKALNQDSEEEGEDN